MATVDNQQSWLPYGSTIDRDCSQGFCNMYCPQWCYVLFSPPPPLSLAGADDDNTAAFSPLVIAIIAILASALILVSYYTFVSRNCASLSFVRRPVHSEEDAVGGGGAAAATVRHEEWHVSPSNGLEEALINKITFLRYKREEGIVDGTDCSVCLGEFKEEESLRLLPKCSHAFHMQCIDTWLKSHANCPLCRASIVLEPDEHEEDMAMIIEEAGRSREEEEEEDDDEEEGDPGADTGEIGEEDAEPVRRCLSMGSSAAAYRGRVSIADVLQMSMEEEYMVAKNCGLVGEGEQNRGNGRNRGLNCVVRTVRMKRSVSSGRFFFGRQGRGRSFLLPVLIIVEGFRSFGAAFEFFF